MGVRCCWSTWKGPTTAMSLTDLSGAADADMLTGKRAHLALLSFHPHFIRYSSTFPPRRCWDDKYLARGRGGECFWLLVDESQDAGTTIFAAAELAPPVVPEGGNIFALYWRFIHFPMSFWMIICAWRERGIFQLSWMNSQGRRDKDLLWSWAHQSSPSSTGGGVSK